MNFYTQQHKHYCGIDLHAKAMYVCIRNYPRILRNEEREDRRAHEIHQSVEDIAVLELGGCNDGG